MSSSNALIIAFSVEMVRYQLGYYMLVLADNIDATMTALVDLGDEPEDEASQERYWAQRIALRCQLVERQAEMLIITAWLAWARTILHLRPQLG
ncbi:hypothetical protein N0V94_001482 [Neodidymelliopsis sp. IMI 364377]|nr:hypothetical protein N0V94_001482 [Neodidymelliopsis sp. IMI 364377]